MRPVLADTSVWRRHFSGKLSRDERASMEQLLLDGLLLVHSWVIGELILGGLSVAEEELLSRLPAAPVVAQDELLAFIRTRRMHRRGIGWVDAQLLAAALIHPSGLWSFDEGLSALAKDLGIRFAAEAPGSS